MMPSTIMGSDAAINGTLGGGGGGFLGASSSSPPSSSRLNFSQMLFQPNMIDGPMHQLHHHHHHLHHHHTSLVDHMVGQQPTSTSDGDNIIARLRDDDFDSNKSGSDNNNTNIEPGASFATDGDQLLLLQDQEEEDPGDGQRPNKKKKRYHRHTQHQIQELESFFKQCPHPDDKQRKELGRELGLKPLQVKFWFQNKRTQMKMQHERSENSQLRAENVKLRADNVRFREALSNAACPTCGGPITAGEMSYDEHQLRIENARLKEEIDRIAAIAAKYVGKPVLNLPIMSNDHLSPRPLELEYNGGVPQTSAAGTVDLYLNNGDIPRSSIINHIGPISDAEKPMIVEMAVAAMEELLQMAQMNDPLWVSPGVDGASSTNLLNEEEYSRMFPRSVSVPNHGEFKTEATRETGIVMMSHMNLVEILMDANQWSTVFASLVSKAMVLEVLSTGVAGTYNGALQVMTAEYQVSSPLVPTRAGNFARYCKQHGDRSWAVVDFSLDNLVPGNPPGVKFKRRPSGCLFHEMPNGYLKITWVEHVEVDSNISSSVHNMYEQLVSSGFAFGAKRWVSTLDRQCERLASFMTTTIPIPNGEVMTNNEGRKNLLKVTERMMVSYCSGVSGSASHSWTGISASGSEDIRVMTRKSVDDPGKPSGVILSAATSLWLPVSPKRFFDYLCNESTRNEWDILSNSGGVQAVINIANGRDAGNCASLIRVISENPSQTNMLILQETCTDATASYVVYAPVDTAAVNVLLSGGNPDFVALLPSGFAILPDRPPPCSPSSTLTTTGGHGGSTTSDGGGGNINTEAGGYRGNGGGGGGGGSLVTVAFQILVDSDPSAKVSLGSVAIINNLIACTVGRIKAAFPGDNIA